MSPPTAEYAAKLYASTASLDDAAHYGRVLFRCWPARGREYLAVFLNGLADLSRVTSRRVFGIWIFPEDDDLVIAPNARTRCELWDASQRTLVLEGTIFEAFGSLARYSGGAAL